MPQGELRVEVENLPRVLAGFGRLEKEMRRNAYGELRRASKQIASAIPGMLGGSGAPQEAAIIAAARPKSDRYVVVKVPGVIPNMRGLRTSGRRLSPTSDVREQARRRKARRDVRMSKLSVVWAIENGTGWPPWHNPAAGSLVSRNMPRAYAYAMPRYVNVIEGLYRKYGLV